jgi:hypothetical protein
MKRHVFIAESKPSTGAWRGLAFVIVVSAASYCLMGVAFGWRLP